MACPSRRADKAVYGRPDVSVSIRLIRLLLSLLALISPLTSVAITFMRTRVLLLGLALSLPSAGFASEPPKLTVVISVDQLPGSPAKGRTFIVHYNKNVRRND